MHTGQIKANVPEDQVGDEPVVVSETVIWSSWPSRARKTNPSVDESVDRGDDGDELADHGITERASSASLYCATSHDTKCADRDNDELTTLSDERVGCRARSSSGTFT